MADILGVKVERLRKWEQLDKDPIDEEDISNIEEKLGPLGKISELDNLPKFQSPSKKMEETLVKDAGGMIIETQVESIATGRVILSILAEVQSHQSEEKTLSTHLLSIYRKMVKDEAEQVRGELKLK